MTNPVSYMLDPDLPYQSPESMGFHWNEIRQRYIYRFIIWRISETQTVYCELQLDPTDNTIELSVFEGQKSYYVPYYLTIWQVEDMDYKEKIFERIERVLHNFNIILNPNRCRPIPPIRHFDYRSA